MEKTSELNIIQRLFPTKEASLHFVEQLRWGKTPVCPHCGSTRVTRFKREPRCHCNACNISFSPMVNTPFHNTRIPLQKWFGALLLLFGNNNKVSVRSLAVAISVNKNTAWQMLERLKPVWEKPRAQVMRKPDPGPLISDIKIKKENDQSVVEVLQNILIGILQTSQ